MGGRAGSRPRNPELPEGAEASEQLRGAREVRDGTGMGKELGEGPEGPEQQAEPGHSVPSKLATKLGFVYLKNRRALLDSSSQDQK